MKKTMANSSNIVSFTEYSPKFWEMMGPNFASREVYRARQNYAMFAEAGMEWLLLTADDTVIGWTALKSEKGALRAQYTFAWTDDSYRRIVSEISQRKGAIIARVHTSKVCTWTALGFREIGNTGAWAQVARGEQDAGT